jgi:hypothetical protein
VESVLEKFSDNGVVAKSEATIDKSFIAKLSDLTWGLYQGKQLYVNAAEISRNGRTIVTRERRLFGLPAPVYGTLTSSEESQNIKLFDLYIKEESRIRHNM